MEIAGLQRRGRQHRNSLLISTIYATLDQVLYAPGLEARSIQYFGGVKMNIWHNINPERIKPHDFVGVIEISEGSKMKYELDKETGALILDRVLYTSTIYPANYGFIPRTFADDSDPLDILVLCSEQIIPMALVRCYPIGAIIMTDGDARDEKIISLPFSDPRYNCYHDISELPSHVFEEMTHFFSIYKKLEHKATAVSEVVGKDEAIQFVRKAMDSYNVQFGKYGY